MIVKNTLYFRKMGKKNDFVDCSDPTSLGDGPLHLFLVIFMYICDDFIANVVSIWVEGVHGTVVTFLHRARLFSKLGEFGMEFWDTVQR